MAMIWTRGAVNVDLFAARADRVGSSVMERLEPVNCVYYRKLKSAPAVFAQNDGTVIGRR
jgi:hypothetical protein